MNNTMISVNGFAKREYEDALEKKGVIPANVVITVEDKTIARAILELFKDKVQKTGVLRMKEIEAFSRGYNELSKSIEAAWGEESEEKHGGVVR